MISIILCIFFGIILFVYIGYDLYTKLHSLNKKYTPGSMYKYLYNTDINNIPALKYTEWGNPEEVEKWCSIDKYNCQGYILYNNPDYPLASYVTKTELVPHPIKSKSNFSYYSK